MTGPGHPGSLDLVILDLITLVLGSQILELLMSPLTLVSHAGSQYQDMMVEIDWIASDTPLIAYVRGRVQHTALNVSSQAG